MAALKAGMSGTIKNEIIAALVEQGIETGSDKFKEYLENMQEELNTVLTDKNLIEMNVSKNHTEYVREEIKKLLLSIDMRDELFRRCRYDAVSLSQALYSKYKEQEKYSVECEGEIRKIISVISEKAISLEKGRKGFIQDSMTYVINSEEESRNLLNKIFDVLDEIKKNGAEKPKLENGKELECQMRLPDRTEEYHRKWNENMFLNDFDEDDEDVGVNIPLYKLYQLLFYKLNGQETELSNLEQRLDRCTYGKNIKSRMLLILGQPGMGKSTMITWFIDWYQKKIDVDKKEVLVYKFTDLDIDWSFNINGETKTGTSVESVMLKCLNMKKENLDGKIIVLDGFDEVSVGSNRIAILNSLYNAWAVETHIKDFSLLITCRENYIGDLYRLSFPYITLQPWNERQIENFCRNYEKLAKSKISEEAIEKMKEMKSVFGVPIILYMVLALEITVRDESSVVEVYDQIFTLEGGGLYDRCLKRKILVSWDKAHRIAKIKKQIHQFSREISMWMFENEPQQEAIPKVEYEKIRDKIFENDSGEGISQKKDVLIGNYFRIVHCYDGVDTEQLSFVHRSIYEYFVVDTICSESKEAISEMTEKAQEKLAGVLGYRLKEGRIDYTIGQYLKAKVSVLTATFSKEKKNYFYVWLEETVGKMLEAGMMYYTEKNIKEYRVIIEKELKCFLNLLEVLRLFLSFSNRKYILQDVNKKQAVLYIRYLTGFGKFKKIDLSRVDLRRADLSRVDLRGADLSRAYLGRADLSGTDLRGADLSGTDLSGANLSDVNLSGANLRGANLSGAELIRGNLSGANLRGTDLSRAYLGRADLSKVDLSKADLRGANLSGVDLRETKLECSKWSQGAVDIYIDFIKQSGCSMIYSYSEKTGDSRKITRMEILARCPDR